MAAHTGLRPLRAGWAGSLSRRQGFTTKLIYGFIFAAFLSAFPLMAAQAESRQKLVYEVYAGGIHAVQATLDIDVLKTGRYDLVLDAHTRGFLASLVPWDGTFESHGWVLNGERFQPEQHKSTTQWRENVDVKDYHYNKDGSFKTLTVTDDHSTSVREVEKDLVDHTTDVLSATLQVLNDYSQSGKCDGASEVFDGKRRFEQSFQHQKMVEFEANKYNIFSGSAAECIVEVTPVAGAWNKKPRGWLSIQEQGRARNMMPTVWIGRLSENGPAVPVKIRVKTAYGTLFMHLAEYRNGKDVRVAEKRVK